jgi:hypothetical protein
VAWAPRNIIIIIIIIIITIIIIIIIIIMIAYSQVKSLTLRAWRPWCSQPVA